MRPGLHKRSLHTQRNVVSADRPTSYGAKGSGTILAAMHAQGIHPPVALGLLFGVRADLSVA
jgi:hypothetical protein